MASLAIGESPECVGGLWSWADVRAVLVLLEVCGASSELSLAVHAWCALLGRWAAAGVGGGCWGGRVVDGCRVRRVLGDDGNGGVWGGGVGTHRRGVYVGGCRHSRAWLPTTVRA